MTGVFLFAEKGNGYKPSKVPPLKLIFSWYVLRYAILCIAHKQWSDKMKHDDHHLPLVISKSTKVTWPVAMKGTILVANLNLK